ncbi:uncharacterized protein [Mytilus edulis]|uniref:uncharacterized protein isoform X2 n=1 Tax=Mytilus edulis TaxID=6550 RepID=UPI0039EF127E
MIDIMQLYILLTIISVSGCSVFIGFPESNWTTSSRVCTHPLIEQINISTIFNNSSNYMVYKNVEKAWTGTVIKYTKWAAFIGCGRSLSPLDSGISVNTVEDCLKHCSEYPVATSFVIKSSRCYCLNNKPETSGTCRTSCTNASNTPCSSDRSALVFKFVKDLKNIEPANTYIEKECITTTKEKSKFIIRDCNEKNLFGCKNTSSELISRSWYDYQEYCLTKHQISVLYNTNTIGNDALVDNSYWTPIFRSHTVVDEIVTGKEVCLTVSKKESKYFIVENCTAQFPFLCSGVQKKKTIYRSTPQNRYPRFINLPLGVVVAGGIFIFLLMMIIIFLSCKLLLSKDTAQVKNDLSIDNTWI